MRVVKEKHLFNLFYLYVFVENFTEKVFIIIGEWQLSQGRKFFFVCYKERVEQILN